MYIENGYGLMQFLGRDTNDQDILGIDDGVWEVQEDTEVLEVKPAYPAHGEAGSQWYREAVPGNLEEVKAFTEKYPEWRFASAYATNIVILLSQPPIRREDLSRGSIGSGFNYGSTNLLENCPKRLLILAQND